MKTLVGSGTFWFVRFPGFWKVQRQGHHRARIKHFLRRCWYLQSFFIWRNTVQLHLPLDGFEMRQNVWEILSHLDACFTGTMHSSFSISSLVSEQKASTNLNYSTRGWWDSNNFATDLLLATNLANFGIEKCLTFGFLLKRRTAKVYGYM